MHKRLIVFSCAIILTLVFIVLQLFEIAIMMLPMIDKTVKGLLVMSFGLMGYELWVNSEFHSGLLNSSFILASHFSLVLSLNVLQSNYQGETQMLLLLVTSLVPIVFMTPVIYGVFNFSYHIRNRK